MDETEFLLSLEFMSLLVLITGTIVGILDYKKRNQEKRSQEEKLHSTLHHPIFWGMKFSKWILAVIWITLALNGCLFLFLPTPFTSIAEAKAQLSIVLSLSELLLSLGILFFILWILFPKIVKKLSSTIVILNIEDEYTRTTKDVTSKEFCGISYASILYYSSRLPQWKTLTTSKNTKISSNCMVHICKYQKTKFLVLLADNLISSIANVNNGHLYERIKLEYLDYGCRGVLNRVPRIDEINDKKFLKNKDGGINYSIPLNKVVELDVSFFGSLYNANHIFSNVTQEDLPVFYIHEVSYYCSKKFQGLVCFMPSLIGGKSKLPRKR